MLDVHHITLRRIEWLSVQCKSLRVGLKSSRWSGNSMIACLSQSCIFPQSITSKSPAMQLMSRQPRSRLDLVHPDFLPKSPQKLMVPKDWRIKIILFHIAGAVRVVNFQGMPKWLPGILEEHIGPLAFPVRLEDGCQWKRRGSYSHEYFYGTYCERHIRIKATYEESRTNILRTLNACRIASCTQQK